jgi:hypothetical protein
MGRNALMSDPANHSVFLVAVRRQWWIPLTVALMGAAIAGVVVSINPAPLFEGRAVISIDSATLSKYPDLPRPDEMLLEAEKPSLIAHIAETTLVPTETVGASLKAYTRDDPQKRLVLSFRSAEESVASTVAVAAATRLTARAAELGDEEIGALQTQVDETERALKAVRRIDARAGGDARLDLDLISTQWEMRLRLYEDRLKLRMLQTAYHYNGNVTVVDARPASRRAGTVGGALILGFVLGMVVAVFREAWLTRSARTD